MRFTVLRRIRAHSVTLPKSVVTLSHALTVSAALALTVHYIAARAYKLSYTFILCPLRFANHQPSSQGCNRM